MAGTVTAGWRAVETLQNAAVATGNGTALNDTQFYNCIMCDVTIATTATVTFEGALDSGQTYASLMAINLATGAVGTTATATGQYLVLHQGLGSFRARISSWTAGAVTVKGQPLYMPGLNVAAIIAGTGATSLGKAEDAAHTSGDTGVMLLAVRQSTPTDLSAGATNGDYEPVQVDSNGNLWNSLGTLLAGEDLTLNRTWGGWKSSFNNITSQTTTVVKSGAGVLHGITINAALANGVITIYDNTSAAGTKIATITQPATILASFGTLTYDVAFSTGLTIVTSGANQDITVEYV